VRDLLADLVLYVHFGYVAFVVVGLVAIYAGALWGAEFVRRRWFRLLHLAAIALVVVEALIGVRCPLTTLEHHLRDGDFTSNRGLIERIVDRVLFSGDHVPKGALVTAYVAVLALTAAAWVRWPPRREVARR
jgi:hypothetical protein